MEVYTAFGCISLKANLTHMADAGTVYIYHGYPEVDVNTLLDPENVDPYSGFPAFRSSRVGIRKKDAVNEARKSSGSIGANARPAVPAPWPAWMRKIRTWSRASGRSDRCIPRKCAGTVR